MHLNCAGDRVEVPVAPDALPPRVNLRHEMKKEKAALGSDEEIVTRLRVIKDLHVRGLLTDEEYQHERDRLLNQLGE